jgi:hypothetical protein
MLEGTRVPSAIFLRLGDNGALGADDQQWILYVPRREEPPNLLGIQGMAAGLFRPVIEGSPDAVHAREGHQSHGYRPIGA